MYWKLTSEVAELPTLEIRQDQTLIIGRNRQCKIKNLKCSRNYCSVRIFNSKKLIICITRNKTFEYVNSGQSIKGPGFVYKVLQVHDNTANLMQSKMELKESNSSSEQAVTSPEQRECGKISWFEIDSGKALLGTYDNGGKASPLIAAFDFDFTLVCTRNGKPFPKDADDWKLFDSHLPKFLTTLVNKMYRIVIISNQFGISSGKVYIDQLKKRFNDSIRSINVPCVVLISTEDDLYRKPRLGLWSYLTDTLQPEVQIDYKQSFYVGDAAGRKKTKLTKSDHSCADLLFALNACLKFMVPERFVHYMRNSNLSTLPDMSASLLPTSCFKPSEVDHSSENTNTMLLDLLTDSSIELDEALPKLLHCIIFTGLPASGKSTFYRKHLHPRGYVHVSRDLLGSMTKCESLLIESFIATRNCVIDNTNLDRESRAKWIELCKAHNVLPIVFYFNLSLQHILHNNKYRKLTSNSSTTPDRVIYIQKSKLQEPTSEEKMSGLFAVPFVFYFAPSEPSAKRRLYYMYLNEK